MPEPRRRDHTPQPVPARRSPSPRPASPLSPTSSALLGLQRAAGNAAVQGALARHRQAVASGPPAVQRNPVQRVGPTAPPPAGSPGQQVITWARAGQWPEAGRFLNGQSMVGILNMLEEVRAAGLLDRLDAQVDTMPGIDRLRLRAATLAVGQHLGQRWKRCAASLPPDQLSAITQHVMARIAAGDVVVPSALVRADGAPFPPPAVDTNAAWIRAFLQFFGFGPPRAPDPTGESVIFDGAARPMAYVVDMVTEQAARSGLLVEPSEAYAVARQLHPTLATPAGTEAPPLLSVQLVLTPGGFQFPVSGPSSVFVVPPRGGRTGALDQAWSPSAAAGLNLQLHRKVEGLRPVFEVGMFVQGGPTVTMNTASAPTTAGGESRTLTGWNVQGYIQPALVVYNRPEGSARRPLALGADQFSVIGQGGAGYTWSSVPDMQGRSVTVLGGPQWTWNLVGDRLQATGAMAGGYTWSWPEGAPTSGGNWFVGFSVGIQLVVPAVRHPAEPSPSSPR